MAGYWILDVWSRDLMGWIEGKSVGVVLPAFTDVFLGSESLECLESAGEVVGRDEIGEMGVELLARVVVIALNGRFLDGSVHSFDLAVGPGMVWFSEPVFDSVGAAQAVEGMAAEAGGGALTVLRQVRELDAMVGEDDMDAIRDGL